MYASAHPRGDVFAGQCRAGAPATCHLVAVEAGDHGTHLAGQVHQDRRRGAAVLRAVVDAGEHDQRRDRRQVEGDRQQHRDGRHRADARQHADQRADCCADEAQQDVHGRQRNGRAHPKVRQKIKHGCARRYLEPRPKLERQVQAVWEQHGAERREHSGPQDRLAPLDVFRRRRAGSALHSHWNSVSSGPSQLPAAQDGVADWNPCGWQYDLRFRAIG